eukprot:scaffold70575_cov69-Phaeocystis_antarctica.AAC.2
MPSSRHSLMTRSRDHFSGCQSFSAGRARDSCRAACSIEASSAAPWPAVAAGCAAPFLRLELEPEPRGEASRSDAVAGTSSPSMRSHGTPVEAPSSSESSKE